MATFRDFAVTNTIGSAAATYNKPSGTVQGDLQLMFVVIDGTGDPLNIPTGGATWSLVDRQNISNGDTDTIAIFAQIAGASEPSTYSQVTAHAGSSVCALIVSYSGVDTTGGTGLSCIAASGFTNPNLVTAPSSPVLMAATAITTTAVNQTVVWLGAVDWNSGTAAAFTDPSSTTRRAVNTPASFVNGLITDFVQASVGTTGTITGTGTLTGQLGNYYAALIALKNSAPTILPLPQQARQFNGRRLPTGQRTFFTPVYFPYSTTNTATYTLTPGGFLTFSGTAIPLHQHTQFPSGSIVFSGVALQLHNKIQIPTGFIVYSGAALEARIRAFNPTGNITFSGVSALVKNKLYLPTGTIVYSGASALIKINVVEPTGLITFSGTAPISFTGTVTRTYTPTGSIVYSGASALIKTNIIEPNGQISFSGIALMIKTNLIQPTGNIAFSGFATITFVSGNSSSPVTTRIPLTGAGIT